MEELLETHPYLFFVYFLLMWLSILFIFSIIGGWRALAENYRLTEPLDGPKKHFQSLSMERIKFLPIGFSNMVTIGANKEGLMLSLLIPFRPFHPPLFITYSELSGHERKFLLFTEIKLRAEKNPDIAISVSAKNARWIEAKSEGHWTYIPKEQAVSF